MVQLCPVIVRATRSHRHPPILVLGLAGLSILATAGRTAAETGLGTSDRPASIIVFPKVMADGGHDTFIQLVNTTNSTRYAHCFYVNGALTSPTDPPGPDNPPLCTVAGFSLKLTGQQPVSWLASQGRAGVPNYQLDPGSVPAAAAGFTGECVCIEVDAQALPLAGNSFVGLATLTSNGDAAKYNAIGLRGFDTNDADSTLCLGGDVATDCPSGAEYEACPAAWLLDQPTDQAEDALVGSGSSVQTDLTLVPCAHDFQSQVPPNFNVGFQLTTEFEEVFAFSTPVSCWSTVTLAAVSGLTAAILGSPTVQTRLTPLSGGFVVVAQETHATGSPLDLTTSAAANAYSEGIGSTQDLIRLP